MARAIWTISYVTAHIGVWVAALCISISMFLMSTGDISFHPILMRFGEGMMFVAAIAWLTSKLFD